MARLLLLVALPAMHASLAMPGRGAGAAARLAPQTGAATSNALAGLRRRARRPGGPLRSAALESVEAVTRGGGGAPGALPRGDALDGTILKLAVPAVLNFVILPLVGTVDTLWVGRLGDPQALAALGAANQVFSSVFFIVSFIPSVVTPLVAAAHASGDEALVKRRVGDALWVSCAVGLFASVMLGLFPGEALKSVLPAGTDAATRAQAQNYLGTRALAMLPAMLGFVGFATFRGILDVVTPLRVSLVTQSLNLILDPILIFGAKLGVTGAALATAASEVASAAIYLTLLARRGVFTVGDGARSLWDRVKPPSPASLAPLFVGGLGVLSRSIAMNTAFICVTRATQALDPTGEAAAAHTIAMQTWQLGGVVLFALSSVAAMLVPSTLNAPVDKGGGKVGAKLVADRMLGWGLAAGLLLAGCQLLALPLLNVFTPVESIREAARAPAMIGALLQLINGVTFVAEGVMQGHQAFFPLAVNAFVASAGLVTSLHLFGSTLPGVWYSFGVFNTIRFVGAMYHHRVTGPLGSRNAGQAAP